jgi:branched-chain amino acid transport system ATP-binding protein
MTDAQASRSGASAVALQSVSAGYGETVVLENVSLTLKPGESISIIGRNGVGKTTLLATIMGHTALHAGQIKLGDRDISRLPIHLRSRAGIGYVPQEREIFPSLSARENLEIAARPGHWTIPAVYELFPQLAQRQTNMGNQLSGGEQQMLAIARALVGNPSVLLMDEPTEGLAPVIVEGLVAAMKRLRGEQGLAILLVEQHSAIALDFAPRTLVINRGRVVFDGESAKLKADKAQLESLIGVAGAEDGK